MDQIEPIRLAFAAFELDEAEARLTNRGRPVALTPKAFGVLCALARRPGQLLTKDALLDAVWGHRHVSESVLKSTISELRAALGDDARQPRFIETASRRGYRFIAALDSHTAVAQPTQPAVGPSRASIGRQAELASVLGAWNAVAAGGRKVVWISGEAGIGKTTLIDRVVARAGPVRLARGQCVEQFGSAEPYLPVLDALADLCRDDPALPPLLRSVAPAWLLQMPWLCGTAERADLQRELTGSHPDRMLREFAELLIRYTRELPLLLVTEDLHWSDHATVRLIDHFARSRGPARVLWLGSFRPADAIVAEHPLAGVRHDCVRGLSDEIALESFSQREVGDYVAGRFADAAASDDFVRSLHADTEGLPLFVVNVVDDLVAQGVIAQGGAGGLPERVAQVPPSVAGVIERRIARLSPEEQAMLEAASVCGVEFSCRTLGEAVTQESSWVEERCESLARHADWLGLADMEPLPDGTLDVRYRFRHALYRHVLYGRVGAHARVNLHRRVARSLEQQQRGDGSCVSAALIASHFDQGREPMAALRHYVGAVESALERLAPTEAVQLIDQALRLLPDCRQSDELLELELVLVSRRDATSSLLSGFDSAQSRIDFERVRALCDLLPQTPQRAWVLLGIGWKFYQRADYQAAHAMTQRLRAIGLEYDDPAVATGACDLGGATLLVEGELDAARQVLEQGLGVFDAARGRLPQAYLRVLDPAASMHSAIATALSHLGLVDQARRRVESSVERANTLGQPLSQMLAFRAAAALDVRTGRAEQVMAWADALRRLVHERGLLMAEGPALWFHGWVLVQRGDLEAGHALIIKGFACRERIGRLSGNTHPLALAAEAMASAGRWEAARRHVDDGLQMAERSGERIFIADLLLQQARVAAGTGDIGRARAALREALHVAAAQHALWLELAALTLWCEIDRESPEPLALLRRADGRLQEGRGTALAVKVQTLLARSGASAGS